MSDGIIILGAGGHAKVIANIVLSCGDKLLGFLDDSARGTVLGYPILGPISDIARYASTYSFLIGIGNNDTRKTLSESYDVSWHTAIHPSASIARDVTIGEGSVVMAGAIISPSAKIGNHCIVNTAAIIGHDNTIEDYVHVSVHATLCGTVRIGRQTQIGAGAVVKNNISVCCGCMIGVGAAVVKNIVIPGVYIGVPAIPVSRGRG